MYKLKSFPGGSHTIIAQILREIKAKTFLDVGSSNGFIGLCLNYKPNILWAVDKVKVRLPGNYSNFTRANVETTSWTFLRSTKFDAIVLADILEHLKRPKQVIKKLKPFLAQNGCFIISVPNMDFWLVSLFKFFGMRPKMDKGLFDSTHRHDFNHKLLAVLLEENFLKKDSITYTPPPLPLISKWFDKGEILYPVHRLVFYLANRFPVPFAYQIIVKVKPI